jgi:hypothetical protein
MRFEEFLKEREYLLGVSKKTLIYYRCAFNSWAKHASDGIAQVYRRMLTRHAMQMTSRNTSLTCFGLMFRKLRTI